MKLGKPICAQFCLSEVCLSNYSSVGLTDSGPFSSFQGGSSSASSFETLLLQDADGVVSLALNLQVMSQALKRFRSSSTRTTCDGCVARQTLCLVTFLGSEMCRTVYPRGVLNIAKRKDIIQHILGRNNKQYWRHSGEEQPNIQHQSGRSNEQYSVCPKQHHSG